MRGDIIGRSLIFEKRNEDVKSFYLINSDNFIRNSRELLFHYWIWIRFWLKYLELKRFRHTLTLKLIDLNWYLIIIWNNYTQKINKTITVEPRLTEPQSFELSINRTPRRSQIIFWSHHIYIYTYIYPLFHCYYGRPNAPTFLSIDSCSETPEEKLL